MSIRSEKNHSMNSLDTSKSSLNGTGNRRTIIILFFLHSIFLFTIGTGQSASEIYSMIGSGEVRIQQKIDSMYDSVLEVPHQVDQFDTGPVKVRCWII